MIGERLKELRTKRNLTIAQTAEALGMNANTYAKYERNERDVSTEGLCKIAEFYNVSADFLLGRAPQTNPFAMLDLQVDIGEDAVMEKYMQLPKDWRKILLDVMRQLGDAAERRARGETIHQMRTIILKCFRDAASAGVGEMLCSSNADYVEVIATPEAEKADFIVRVSGDSMEPTFYDGDLLLCEEVADLEEGDIGVFRHNGTGYVKEYSKAGLISHNPAYDRIPKSRLEGLEISGKVLGIAQLVKF